MSSSPDRTPSTPAGNDPSGTGPGNPDTSGHSGASSAPDATGAGPERPPRRHRRSGDGWVETPEGKFWGKFGAAGLLIHDLERGVLLQHRVAWSAQGGTWGIPGGAIDAGETALAGAIRESHEEAGVPELDGTGVEVIGTHVLEKEGWSYTTVIARATTHLEEFVNDIESVALAWVPLDEVADYPLHPGFENAWPHLRSVLEENLPAGE